MGENKWLQAELTRIEVRKEVADQEVKRQQDKVRTAEKELEKRESQISRVLAENQNLRSEKKEMKRQMKIDQNRIAAAEKELKAKELKIDQLVHQNEALVVEKTWMKTQLVKAENQLEGVKGNLLVEESCRAAAEKQVKRMEELMSERARFEQAERKAVEKKLADSKHRETELRNSVQQMMSVGESILKSKHQEVEQHGDFEIRSQGKQVGDVQPPPSSGNSTSHTRLVEKLLKRIKQPPISPADCSRLVQKLRASQNGLSGLLMEVIEEDVRRMGGGGGESQGVSNLL